MDTGNMIFMRYRQEDAFQRAKAQRTQRTAAVSLGALSLLLLLGCRQDMQDQPKFYPQRGTSLFADGRSARPQASGTVARSQGTQGDYFHTGMSGNAEGDGMPLPVTAELLARGQERFNIYCTPCHSRTGYGHGMIVQRGYLAAANFHTNRLREAPLGHFFAVMTNGYGSMPEYAAQLTPEERWAVVAYIRALQLSQHATAADTGGTPVRPLKSIAESEGFNGQLADTSFWMAPGAPVPLPAPVSSKAVAAIAPSPDTAAPAAASTPTTAAGPAAAATLPASSPRETAAKDAAAAPAPAPKAHTGIAAAGQELYMAKCSLCHNTDLAGKPPMFPSLQGVIQRKGEVHARTVIVNGTPDARPMMPAFGQLITDEDLDNVVAFLKTVKAQAPAADRP